MFDANRPNQPASERPAERRDGDDQTVTEELCKYASLTAEEFKKLLDDRYKEIIKHQETCEDCRRRILRTINHW